MNRTERLFLIGAASLAALYFVASITLTIAVKSHGRSCGYPDGLAPVECKILR